MPVYLIGLPGSGKTSLGRQLAELLRLPFFDLDAEIETETGRKIPDLFEAGGESLFREAERKCLQRFLKPGDFILATGGGTACFFDNMNQMLQSGTVVFLNPPMDEILRRLDSKATVVRPLFSGSESIAVKLKSLFDERIGFYRKAHITWAGNGAADLASILRTNS